MGLDLGDGHTPQKKQNTHTHTNVAQPLFQPVTTHALRVCLCLATASSSGTRSGGVGSTLTVCSDSPTGRTLGDACNGMGR